MLRLENIGPRNCQRRRWNTILIILTISVLTVSLGTRTSTPTVFHGITAQQHSPRVMRQHLNTDAAEWVPPVAVVVASEVVSLYPPVSPEGPPTPSVFFEPSLYNRPPPF